MYFAARAEEFSERCVIYNTLAIYEVEAKDEFFYFIPYNTLQQHLYTAAGIELPDIFIAFVGAT